MAVVDDVGLGGLGILLTTHGNDRNVTFGVLPLALFPSTLLLLPSLVAPFSHFRRPTRRLRYIGGVRNLGYLSSGISVLV